MKAHILVYQRMKHVWRELKQCQKIFATSFKALYLKEDCNIMRNGQNEHSYYHCTKQFPVLWMKNFLITFSRIFLHFFSNIHRMNNSAIVGLAPPGKAKVSAPKK